MDNVPATDAAADAQRHPARADPHPGRTGVWAGRLMVVASGALLGAGLVGPCMTIIPSLGELDFWVRLLKPGMGRPTTYSMLGGIIEIMRHENWWIGVLLLTFSCVFPTVKLTIMSAALSLLARGRSGGVLLEFAHHTGKFSMLDVLVIALVVIAVNGLPGRTAVQLHWGVYVFAASVVLSLAASVLLNRLQRGAESARAEWA